MEGFKDTETSLELGPAIATQVAQGLSTVVKRPLSKPTMATMIDKLKVPANCTSIQVPKMNQEIWNHLPTRAKMNDLQLQSSQQTMTYGLVALAHLGNLLANHSKQVPKDLGKSMIGVIMDGANMLGHGIQQLNNKRRSEVKGHIQPEYAGICATTVPVTGYLFGDDLKESLKTSKSAAAVVRTGVVKRRFPPFRSIKPYASGQNSFRQGNRFRPPQQTQRRGGGFQMRAASANFQSNQQPSRQQFQK